MADPAEVLLRFAFIAVLYLFLLWVTRSALKDLRRPAPSAPPTPAPSSATVSRAGLVVEGGGGLRSGDWFEIGPGLTIGRAPNAEVRIEDGFASGHHARVYGHDGGAVVEDLSSTNGTFVNGRRLTGPQRLAAEDRIRIGDTEFRFLEAR